MAARLYVDADLAAGQPLSLPPDAARHAQVLRLQPGDALVLFNGRGGEWQAQVAQMGRRDVEVVPLAWQPVERELPSAITLAVGVPANDRFDWLIEKATELGVAGIQPLECERSVLRLSPERAARKRAHWQGIAIAAAEQSGRTRVPAVADPLPLRAWLASPPMADAEPPARWLLHPGAPAWRPAAGLAGPVQFLSGPEGGLTDTECDLALRCGFVPAGLGPTILRADTAPLVAAALAAAACREQ